MIAQNNSAMAATANSIFQYDADEAILKQIEDREDALREALRTKKRMDDLERENAEQKDTIAEQKDTITRQNEEIARLQAALAAKQ